MRVIIADIVVHMADNFEVKYKKGLVEIDLTGLAKWLSESQKNLKDFRITFISQTKIFMDELGKKVSLLAKTESPVDTGTMRKRVDYKILLWNRIIFGIFEPTSKYYDSARHYPTNEFMHKYSGWKPSPLVKVYAQYPYDKNPFFNKIIEDVVNKEMKDFVKEFMKKYLPV